MSQTARNSKDMDPHRSWRLAQACLAALAVDRAWARVQAALEATPDTVLAYLARLAGVAPAPRARQLALVCARRRARNEEAAAGAASAAQLESWPADLLAGIAHRRLAKKDDLKATAAAVAAALSAWEQFKQLDQQARHAPARMEELRRLKGAL